MSVLISDYFIFQVADISSRYQVLQTYVEHNLLDTIKN